MGITFLDLAKRVLEETKTPMSATEIWNYAETNNYEKELDSKGLTPYATLGARLYVDVRDNNKSSFYSIGSRPKKFFLTNLRNLVDETLTTELQDETKKVNSFGFLEKDLHAVMV